MKKRFRCCYGSFWPQYSVDFLIPIQIAKLWIICFVFAGLLIKFGLIIIRLWVSHYQATEFVKSFKGGLRVLYVMQWES